MTPSDHLHLTARTSASPRRDPRPWLLAGSHPTRHTIGTSSWQSMSARLRFRRSQCPWFASVGRCFPPGFVAGHTGQIADCRRRILCLLAPARHSLLRWVVLTMARHPFACAAHRCLRDGIPGVRLPGSAVSPRFRPLKTSRGSGGDAVTPAPGGRGLHPHGTCVTKPVALRSAREPQSSFDQRIARKCKRYWLLLDSRVVDVTRSYNPIFITISSLKPFLFNDLINEWRFVDRMEA